MNSYHSATFRRSYEPTSARVALTTRAIKLLPIFLVGIAGGVVCPVPEVQAEIKVATVDVGKILNESPEAKAERAKIDAARAEAKKKVESQGSALKELEAKLKAQNLGDDAPEVQSFREKAREFSRFVKDTDEDIKKKFLKANNLLTEKALEQVRAYAKTKGIELVLDKSSLQRGPVLFGGDQIDITNDIIKRLRDGER